MTFNFLREPTVPRTPPSTLMEISEGGVRGTVGSLRKLNCMAQNRLYCKKEPTQYNAEPSL
jgi:hypothetical protein